MSEEQYLLHRDGLGGFLLQNLDNGIIGGRLFPAQPGENARVFSYDYGSVWYPQQIVNLKDFPELSEMPFFTIDICSSFDLDRYFKDINSQVIWQLLGTFAKFIGYSFSSNEFFPPPPQLLWQCSIPNPQGSWTVPILGLWVNHQGCWVSNRDGWVLRINNQGEILEKQQLPKLTRCLTALADKTYVACDDEQIYDLTGKVPQPIYNVRPPDNYDYTYQLFALEKTADSLVIVDAYGNLTCLNSELEIDWKKQRYPRWLSSFLVTDRKRLYQGYYQGLICYNKKTGDIIWEKSTEAPVLCGTLLKDQIIFGCSDRHIYSISTKSKSKREIIPIFPCPGIPYALCATPDQKFLFISDYQGKIYRLDIQGNLQETINLDCEAAIAMKIWESHLYIGTNQGVVACLALEEIAEEPMQSLSKESIIPTEK